VGSGNLALTLNEANGNITGTGALTVSGDALALTVTGNYAPPNVSLQLTSTGFEPMNLSGTLSQDEIRGTLNGSGFVNIAVTLERQEPHVTRASSAEPRLRRLDRLLAMRVEGELHDPGPRVCGQQAELRAGGHPGECPRSSVELR
jgi:hypothetical protein